MFFFCGGFAPSSRIWCRISWPLDWFFIFLVDLHLGFELQPSLVSFLFRAFLSSFVWGFFGLCFCFSKGFASTTFRPLRVFYAPPLHLATIATPLSSSRLARVWASPQLFYVYVLFPCFRFIYIYIYIFLFLCFCSSANLLHTYFVALRPLLGLSS
jgi:hypothetical protein